MKNYINKQLEIGNWIEFQGEIFTFEGIDPYNTQYYMFKNTDTQATIPISYTDLCTSTSQLIIAKSESQLNKKMIAISELAEQEITCFDETSEYYRKAKKIIEIVINIDEKLFLIEQNYFSEWSDMNNGNTSPPKFKKTNFLNDLCEEFGICKSTYYNYKKCLDRNNKNIHEVASSFVRKNRGVSKFDFSTIHFVDTLIMREYANKNRRLKKSFFYEEILKTIHGRLNNYWIDFENCKEGTPLDLVDKLLNPNNPHIDLIIQKNINQLKKIDLPKKSWIYNYLNWFTSLPENGKQIINNRYGKGVWKNEFEIFDTYIHKAEYPLQYVFADHAYLDIFLTDDETRSKTFRIWLTILIDAYSRSILGFELSHKSPCIESIIGAIRNSLIDKTQLLNQYNIQKSWPCFGKPWSISLDNAWAHRSHTLEELARYLEISLEYRPPYRARYGAIVERAFGHIQGKLKSLFPAAIVDPKKKGKINAYHEAIFTFDDLYEFILKMIVNYQNHPHSSLKQTPNDAWNHGVQIIPPQPIMITQVLDRKMWTLLPGERVIGPKGISYFSMNYSSNELKEKGIQIGFNGKKKIFRLSVDKNDISKLAVWDMSGTLHTHPIYGNKNNGKGNLVCDVFAKELRQSNGEYFKISYTAYELAKAIQKEVVNKDSHWLDYLNSIKEKASIRKKEKKSIRKQKLPSKANKIRHDSSEITNYSITRKENERLTKLLSEFND